MMTQELLPQIRTLAGDARRVTLIFDREGWSPKTFRTWTTAGFDVITYRKGRYRDWQRRCFTEVTPPPEGDVPVGWCAWQGISHAGQAAVRERSPAVVTTRRDLSIETVAADVLPLAAGELLPYMRHEFALDHLPSTAVEPADPERSVPNPAVTEKKRELGQVAQLAKAEQAYAAGTRHRRAAASHGAGLHDLPCGVGTDDQEPVLGPRATGR